MLQPYSVTNYTDGSSKTSEPLIMGSYGDDAGVVRSIPVYSSFLDFCFSDKGVWMYEDSDSYLYVISPVSDEWFRMKI